MDTHQDRLSDDGSSGVGAQRSPSVVMFMRRPLIVATVLESAAPKLMGKKASASYRADLLQEPEKKSDTTLADVGKRLIAGGIAGAIAKTCIAPLDRVKIIFQTHPAKHFSLSNVVHELVFCPPLSPNALRLSTSPPVAYCVPIRISFTTKRRYNDAHVHTVVLVCVSVCMCVRGYVCLCVSRAQNFVHESVYVRYVQIYLYMNTYEYIYICMCMYAYIYKCTEI